MKPYERIEVPEWIEREIALTEQIEEAKREIAKYDYIGIKIATGVATIEEYAEEIDYMESIRAVIREIEEELSNLSN